MAPVDYMKVIDIISKTFNADKTVDLEASHDKVDIFDVTATLSSGAKLKYRILMHNYELDIVIPIRAFGDMKFSKWLSLFEYELEQSFMRNIKIETQEGPGEYRIRTSF
ncbi:MAG TPA: hypothetical protein ENN21_05315 [Spirochaetes bacterium]|nr:hypothetical protein [Spirochaetota bacterium]